MGLSDKYYFNWQTNYSKTLSSFLDKKKKYKILCLGETNIPFIVHQLLKDGILVEKCITFDFHDVGAKSYKEFFKKEKYSNKINTQHILGDFNNDLHKLSIDSFDLIFGLRMSCHLYNPIEFLKIVKKLLKKNGFLFIDWMHGYSDYPLLDLGYEYSNKANNYSGIQSLKYQTTYIDNQFLNEFSQYFMKLIEDINSPFIFKRMKALKKRKYYYAFKQPYELKKNMKVVLNLKNYITEIKKTKIKVIENKIINLIGFHLLKRDIFFSSYKHINKTSFFIATLLQKKN